jgi:hypothetical protein
MEQPEEDNSPDFIIDLKSFERTRSQHTFKQSSTAFLSITFIIFFIYSAFKFYRNMKTNFGLDVRVFD